MAIFNSYFDITRGYLGLSQAILDYSRDQAVANWVPTTQQTPSGRIMMMAIDAIDFPM